jgi:hypothetical protein
MFWLEGTTDPPETMSGRDDPVELSQELAKFVPEGSAPGTCTMRNGPVWKRQHSCQSPN